MNNQEAFDKMVTHLFTQKVAAKTTDEDDLGKHTKCFYRMEGGLKCAVGALITDEEYRETFEDNTASSITQLVPSLVEVDGNMLNAAQSIHDYADPVDWYERFNSMADKYKLNTTKLQEYKHTSM